MYVPEDLELPYLGNLDRIFWQIWKTCFSFDSGKHGCAGSSTVHNLGVDAVCLAQAHVVQRFKKQLLSLWCIPVAIDLSLVYPEKNAFC